MIATDPAAGTELQVGSPVTVLVSSGPAQVHVPDVTGQAQSGGRSGADDGGPGGRRDHPAGLGRTGAGHGARAVPGRRASLPRRREGEPDGRAGARRKWPSRAWSGRARRRPRRRSAAPGSRRRRDLADDDRTGQVGVVLKQSPAGGHTRAQGRHGDDHDRRAAGQRRRRRRRRRPRRRRPRPPRRPRRHPLPPRPR